MHRAQRVRDMNRRHSRNQSDPTSEISLKILRYLDQNPNAADTLDGILEWWLPKQSLYEQEKIGQRALNSLVEQRLLLIQQSTDARKHYRLNVDRIQEIRRVLTKANDV
jgi:hypothetical protein